MSQFEQEPTTGVDIDADDGEIIADAEQDGEPAKVIDNLEELEESDESE